MFGTEPKTFSAEDLVKNVFFFPVGGRSKESTWEVWRSLRLTFQKGQKVAFFLFRLITFLLRGTKPWNGFVKNRSTEYILSNETMLEEIESVISEAIEFDFRDRSPQVSRLGFLVNFEF